MLLKKKVIPAMFGAFVSLGLVACGSDSADTVGVGAATGVGATGDTSTGSSNNSAHTIVLTYPYSTLITNEEDGTYRRIGVAIVTDNEGNPVPDGTKVSLNVIDSILATGTIDAGDGDSVTGSVLTDTLPMTAAGDATTFDVVSIKRNGEEHFIENWDHILLFNADASDINRVIAPGEGMITANTLAVTSDYSMAYPDSAYYPTGTTAYVVGVSSLGAHVLGTETDADGAVTITAEGHSLTKNGRATFYVAYPANVSTINTGCVDPTLDTRVSPVGSAQVFLIASAGANATTVDSRFCFSRIAQGTLTASPADALSDSGVVDFTLRDGGDGVRSPFTTVYTTIVRSGATSVTLGGGVEESGRYVYRTDEGGRFSSIITVEGAVAGDTVEITYATAENHETAKVTVTIPG